MFEKEAKEIIVEAKEIIRDLIFDLVAIDVEQAEGLDSVKKAKQFFREIDKRNGGFDFRKDLLQLRK